MEATAQVNENIGNIVKAKNYFKGLMDEKQAKYDNLPEDQYGNTECFALADEIDALDALITDIDGVLDTASSTFKDLKIESNDNVAEV